MHKVMKTRALIVKGTGKGFANCSCKLRPCICVCPAQQGGLHLLLQAACVQTFPDIFFLSRCMLFHIASSSQQSCITAAAAAGSYGQHAPYATTELSVASREPSDTHLSLDNGPIPPGGYLPSPSRGSSAHKVAPTHSGSPHTPGKKLPSAIRLNGDAGLQGINTAAVQDTQVRLSHACQCDASIAACEHPSTKLLCQAQ